MIQSTFLGIFSPRPGMQEIPEVNRIKKESSSDKASPRPDVKSSTGGIFSPRPGTQADLEVDDFKLDQSAQKKIPASIPAHVTADMKTQSEPSPRPDMKSSKGGTQKIIQQVCVGGGRHLYFFLVKFNTVKVVKMRKKSTHKTLRIFCMIVFCVQFSNIYIVYFFILK